MIRNDSFSLDSTTIPQSLESLDVSDMMVALREFISFKSVSSDELYRDDCWKCAKYLQSILEDIGAEVRVTQSRNKKCNPCIIARVGKFFKEKVLLGQAYIKFY